MSKFSQIAIIVILSIGLGCACGIHYNDICMVFFIPICLGIGVYFGYLIKKRIENKEG